jgi:multidrug efflux pump subunit AcrA (membrane-fusion protein)
MNARVCRTGAACLFALLAFLSKIALADTAGDRAANTIVLDEVAITNLRLETVEAEEREFEETLFALGRIEAIPARRSVVSSRIPGRVVELKVTLGERVAAGAEVARLESRQAGEPPPSVMLKAPLGGLVTESQARIGEPVEPEKALLEITDLSEVQAVARVPEHSAGALKARTRARIRVAAASGEYSAELVRFGTAANAEAGTLDAIFLLPNPGLLLRPGMRAEFSIVRSARTGVMSIPREALQGDAADRHVFVRDFELRNGFVKTAVQTGAQNDQFVEVTAGLLPGDEVVTRGAYALAFAGKGSISLKEALDAAHGHPHNEDGSEMTAEQRAASASRSSAGNAQSQSPLVLFLAGTSAVLLVLLILSLVRRGSPATT